MAKVSPLIRSFNGGEVSKLVEGRTDLDRYPSSNRALLNFVAAPQGPAVPRSGTQFVAASYKPDKKSSLVSFVFDDEEDDQMYVVEFTDGRVRFLSDEGLLIYPTVAATGTATSPFTFTSPALTALGAAVGMQVALYEFADHYNLNGEVANILTKVGDTYTIDAVYPALALDTNIEVGLVYSIASPYTEAQLERVRDLQSLDVVYLFNGSVRPQKLKRNDTYNWAFEPVDFLDGPYMDVNETMTKITPSATGNMIPEMTSDTLPAGYTASSTGAVASAEAFKAFDSSPTSTYWASTGNQSGTLAIQMPAAAIADGYSITVGTNNSNTSFLSKDYAPSTFTFEGSNDGVTWTVLDRQRTYVLYDNKKSKFFELKNSVAYNRYRIVVEEVTRNGSIGPIIGRLSIRSTTSASMTLTASATTGINNGQGFLSTDIGRLLRLQGSDSIWRSFKITARSSTTVVTATLLGEPLPNLEPIAKWRLGHWSDTTGYPVCGAFFQDRLWMAGSKQFPDLLVSSVSFAYEDLTPSDPDGVVLDEHSIVRRINSRRLARIKWLAESDKGLLVGTGSREGVVSTADGSGKTITPDNAKITLSSSRGSSNMEPVQVDAQVLFGQRSGRAIREFAWVYESDSFKAPSMSLLASHLGVQPFEQAAYAAEPYSIVWFRRRDGSVVGLTYNRDENVVGWHRHDFSGGVVESLCVLPSADKLQDTLWLVVRRTVNGSAVRYIEKLTRFWDFDMTLEIAHYVDCALRYNGDPTNVLFGLQHLEGQDVYGLADGLPFGPLPIVGGALILPDEKEASNIIVGLGFDAEGETSGLENGAQDGTAQGKEKRMNAMKVNVWNSYGGEVGTWNEDKEEPVYEPLMYPTPYDVLTEINLFSGILGPITLQPGYEKRGSVFFRRPKSSPLPFNLISLMPTLVTQDG